MSSQRTISSIIATLVSAGLGLGLWSCTADEAPTEVSSTEVSPSSNTLEADAASVPRIVDKVFLRGGPYGVAVSGAASSM